MFTAESKFVEVDGVNTHYLEAGPKDAPTVDYLPVNSAVARDQLGVYHSSISPTFSCTCSGLAWFWPHRQGV